MAIENPGSWHRWRRRRWWFSTTERRRSPCHARGTCADCRGWRPDMCCSTLSWQRLNPPTGDKQARRTIGACAVDSTSIRLCQVHPEVSHRCTLTRRPVSPTRGYRLNIFTAIILRAQDSGRRLENSPLLHRIEWIHHHFRFLRLPLDSEKSFAAKSSRGVCYLFTRVMRCCYMGLFIGLRASFFSRSGYG